ncbi:hypothetical protein Tco_1509704 [Tanacetum coccineum]
MKICFISSQVFIKSDEVLPNHLLAAPVRVKGKIHSIMSFPEIPGVLNNLAISRMFRKCSIASSVTLPEKVFLPLLVSYYDLEPDIVLVFIEGINIVDCDGCDIFSVLKFPFKE